MATARRRETVAGRAKWVLEQTGWTQTMLAQELGVTQATVSRILSGQRTSGPVLRHLARLEADVMVALGSRGSRPGKP